jgi:hypothetical protein
MLILRLAQSFQKHKVQYAVAGGMAVALHGAVRGTVDIDVVVALKKNNLENAQKALESMGFKPRQPVNAADIAAFRQEYIDNRNMIAWSFVNHSNPAEIVDILLPEELNKFKVVHKTIGKEKIPVVAIVDLIRMKKASGRPQDLEDVKALRSL